MRRCTSTPESCMQTKRACWNDENNKPSKKNAKKKKGERRKRACWTAVGDQPSKKIPKQKERGATRGLPRRSPILVELKPKHASLRSSDGIRCISVGMIAPISKSALNPYKESECDDALQHQRVARKQIERVGTM